MAKVCFDTNVLLEYPNVLDEYDDIILPSAVLEEIDGLKKSKEIGHVAREVHRKLEENLNKIKFDVKDDYSSDMPMEWDREKRDNKIVMCAKEFGCKLISNDINVRVKCKAVGVEYEGYGDGFKKDINYKGWIEFKGSSDEVNGFYQKVYDGNIKFLTNQYLILTNTETNKTTEERFDGNSFVELSLPPSKVIKALNSQQRCALDLLYNKDIPIKIINGTFGSGKTLLTTKVGLHLVVDKGIYRSLLFLRNPLPADDTDIGWLKGSKEDKIFEYMKPILQYIESEKNQAYAEMLIKNEQLKLDVISFIKGANIDDTFIMCDEAEDLNVKLIKLIGSRMAKKSCIVFTGDHSQAEKKYKTNNGLLKLINETKGNPLVGIVNLPEDLRSQASKVFANL